MKFRDLGKFLRIFETNITKNTTITDFIDT